MDFPSRFSDFLVRNDLLPAGSEVLLAVSGGVDSVVMLRLFKVLFPAASVGVLHCNFQLRGAESDEDELFVRDLAAGYELPFFTKRFDTAVFAQEKGLSIQMAARELRYAWFEEVRQSEGFDLIATAHHLDDSLETALLNFTRGTGLNGLTGIPLRTGRIIRPLLFATRAEIIAFAESQNLAWREDSSNAQDDYARNFLRHQVLPKLLELNPKLPQTAARNFARLSATRAAQEVFLENFRARAFAPLPDQAGFKIEKAAFEGFPMRRYFLMEVFKAQDFTEEQMRQLDEGWERSGFEWRSGEWRLLVDRNNLLLSPIEEGDQAPSSSLMPGVSIFEDDLLVRLPDGSSIGLLPGAPAPPFPDGAQAILVDRAALQFPLQVRPWKPGDAFQPFGMGGYSQKLQDFFTNLKLSRLEKEHAWVLADAWERIVWVLGHRPDERFKVTEKTEQALKINWIR